MKENPPRTPPTIPEYVRELDERLGGLSPAAARSRLGAFAKAQPEIRALFDAVREGWPEAEFPAEGFFYAYALHGFLRDVLGADEPRHEVKDVLQAAETVDLRFRAAAGDTPCAVDDLGGLLFPNGSPVAGFGALWDRYLADLLEDGLLDADLGAALRKFYAVALLLADETASLRPARI
ncbi:MAG: hypothetical protein KA419_08190 [Acidobacteria bacterium]|nr:hypothetical protein [Acidobacteriota bacterium]